MQNLLVVYKDLLSGGYDYMEFEAHDDFILDSYIKWRNEQGEYVEVVRAVRGWPVYLREKTRVIAWELDNERG